MSRLNQNLWKVATRVSPKLAKLDSANKDLVRRTFNSMFMRVIRTGISFVFAWLLARILDTNGQGIYEQALNVTVIASVIGRFGMDQAVTRFVAANASQNNWKEVGGVYRYAMMYTAGLSSIAVVVVFLLSPTLATLFGDQNMVEPMRWMSLAILPYGLVMIQSYLLQGIERIEDSIFVQTLGIPIVNIPFLILLSGQYGVTGAAMSYLLSTCLIAFLGYRLWKRYTPQLNEIDGDFDRAQLLATSRPLLVNDLSSTLLGRLDVILLGVFSTSSAVGIYAAGKRISNLASAFLSATSFVAAPKFASMYAQGQMEKLGSLARNAARLTTLISIPYLIVFLLFPAQVMNIFGENYTEGAVVLSLLAIGQFINSATGAVGYLLIMTGREKLMRNLTLGTSLLKVALLVILIPPFGYIGAALATMIGDSARNLLAVVAVYQELDIITIPIPDWLAKRLAKSKLAASSSTAS